MKQVKQPFTVFVMQSAHTDIGYTHPQEQIADMYLDHYDLVLELCNRSADTPAAHRFKWVCETFWQVQHYLTHRPERLNDFLGYMRSGQIEVVANYLHFTDMIDADAYRRSLQAALDFREQHDVPVQCALHCDINGWPWAVADILAEAKIPYFCSQIHLDSATDPLGKHGSTHYQTRLQDPRVRPDAPFRTPQAFWWQGPQGGRVLHWLNEHYLLGNILGVSSAQPFDTNKTRYFYETDQLGVDDLMGIARRELPRYVDSLKQNGYGYDRALLSTGGFFTDNSRPDDRWCSLIARWNAEHDDICLRTATLTEWFEALSAQNLDHLPVYQVAWPDAWAHGLGSATARIAQARRTQRRRPDIVKLVEQAQSSAASSYLNRALEQERQALEHTFCAWSTTAHPESPMNDFQRIVKEATFHRAELYFDEALSAALRALVPDSDGKLYVYHDQPDGLRTVLRTVCFGAGDKRLDPARQQLVAQDGTRHAFQSDSGQLQLFTAALPLSAGLNAFQVITRDQHAETAAPAVPAVPLEVHTDSWSLRVDPATGGLASLRDVVANREWVAPGGRYAFGQLVHEAVIHPLGREAVGNLARYIALDIATPEARQQLTPDSVAEYTTPRAVGATARRTGPVFDEIGWRGSAAPIGDVSLSWRCYHRVPIVELVIDWYKIWCDRPEAAYVAFPFAAPGARLEFETGGGFFQPGHHGAGGQMPGTCSTYYTVQRAARITQGDARLFWVPLDAPLVMPNQIKFNRWDTDPWQWNGFLASMPVNHYWHTNFPTSQRGFIRLRYRLSSSEAFAEVDSLLDLMPSDAIGWR